MAHKHRKGLASREMKCVYRVALRRICDFDSPPAVFGEAAGLRRVRYSDEWSNLILEGTGEFSKHLEGMHESTFWGLSVLRGRHFGLSSDLCKAGINAVFARDSTCAPIFNT